MGFFQLFYSFIFTCLGLSLWFLSRSITSFYIFHLFSIPVFLMCFSSLLSTSSFSYSGESVFLVFSILVTLVAVPFQEAFRFLAFLTFNSFTLPNTLLCKTISLFQSLLPKELQTFSVWLVFPLSWKTASFFLYMMEVPSSVEIAFCLTPSIKKQDLSYLM